MSALESGDLVSDLVHGLAAAPSGVGFIASALDRIIEHHRLRMAQAVLSDPVLGIQVFNAGRRPFEFDQLPSAVIGRGQGIHTDPTVPDATHELDTVLRLCQVALRLDRLHYESLHDPLTGLYNRRGFDELVSASISRSLRYGWGFALVLLDLDGFKEINDRVGHQAGDEVLRAVSDRFRQGVRAGDIAGRIGGDEFGLLIHFDEVEGVEHVLDRLGHGEPITHHEVAVGWTVGVARCPDEAATVDDLYRIADLRLYEAKTADDGGSER